MPDYNLGRAHGEIEITADTRGAQEAQAAMAATAAEAEVLDKSMTKVNEQFDKNRRASVMSAEALVRERGAVEDLRKTYERYNQDAERAATRKQDAQRKFAEANRRETTDVNELLRLGRETQRLHDQEQRMVQRSEDAYARYQGRLSALRLEVERFNQAHTMAAVGFANMRREAEQMGNSLEKLADKMTGFVKILSTTGTYGLFGAGAGGLLSLAGGSGLQGLTIGMGAVLEVVKDFSGAMLLIPGAVNTAVVSLGTLKAAFYGVGEAIQASMTDPAKFIESLRQLSPAARDVAIQFAQFSYAFRGAREMIQESMFQPLIDQIRPLIYTWLPQLMHAGQQIAGQFGQAFRQVFQFFQTPQMQAGFQTFINNLVNSFQTLRGAIQPFLQAWNTLATTGSQAFGRLAQAIVTVVNEFNSWVQRASASGQLINMINRALDGFTKLWHIIRDIGGGLNTMFNIASSVGGDFLTIIANIAAEFRAWTESARGQNELLNFFTLLKEAAQAMHPLWHLLGEAISTVVGAFTRLGIAISGGLTNFFTSLVESLKLLAPVLEAMAPTLNQFLTELGQMLVSIVRELGPRLPQFFQDFADALSETMYWLPGAAHMLGELMSHFTQHNIELLIGFVTAVKGLSALNSLVGILSGLSNPLTLVIAGIALLVIGITLLITHWDQVKTKVGEVTEKFGGMSGIIDGLKRAWNGLTDTVSGWWRAVTNAIGGAWDTLVASFEEIKNKVVNWWNGIDFTDLGRKLIHGLIDGIKSMAQAVVDAVKDDILQPVRDLLPSSRAKDGPFSQASPEELGTNLSQGYAYGIQTGSGAAIDASGQVASGVYGSLSGGGGAGGAGAAPGGGGAGGGGTFVSSGNVFQSGGKQVSGFDQYIAFVTQDMQAWLKIAQDGWSLFQNITKIVTDTTRIVADLWNRGNNPLTQPGGLYGPPMPYGQNQVPGVPNVPIPGVPPDKWATMLPGATVPQIAPPGVPQIGPYGLPLAPGQPGFIGPVAGPAVGQAQVPGVPNVRRPGDRGFIGPVVAPPPAANAPTLPAADPHGPAATFDQSTQQWMQNGHPVRNPSQPAQLSSVQGQNPPTGGPASYAQNAADSPLLAALKDRGFSPQLIRAIQGFSQAEGLNPAGNPTLGFRDDQLGGDTSLQGHVNALADQFQRRVGAKTPDGRTIGQFPAGGSDRDQAEWFADVVGQVGSPNDIFGAQQPPRERYVQSVITGMQGVQAPTPTNIRPTDVAQPLPPARGQLRPGVLQGGPEAGLRPAGTNLAGIVETLWPQIQTIGGVHPDALPYHPTGHALDIMIPGDYNSPEGIAMGNQMLDFLRSNAQSLGIYDLIYRSNYYRTGEDPTPYQYTGTDQDQLHNTHIHVTLGGWPGGGGPEPNNFETDINRLVNLPPSYRAPPSAQPVAPVGQVGNQQKPGDHAQLQHAKDLAEHYRQRAGAILGGLVPESLKTGVTPWALGGAGAVAGGLFTYAGASAAWARVPHPIEWWRQGQIRSAEAGMRLDILRGMTPEEMAAMGIARPEDIILPDVPPQGLDFGALQELGIDPNMPATQALARLRQIASPEQLRAMMPAERASLLGRIQNALGGGRDSFMARALPRIPTEFRPSVPPGTLFQRLLTAPDLYAAGQRIPVTPMDAANLARLQQFPRFLPGQQFGRTAAERAGVYQGAPYAEAGRLRPFEGGPTLEDIARQPTNIRDITADTAKGMPEVGPGIGGRILSVGGKVVDFAGIPLLIDATGQIIGQMPKGAQGPAAVGAAVTIGGAAAAGGAAAGVPLAPAAIGAGILMAGATAFGAARGQEPTRGPGITTPAQRWVQRPDGGIVPVLPGDDESKLLAAFPGSKIITAPGGAPAPQPQPTAPPVSQILLPTQRPPQGPAPINLIPGAPGSPVGAQVGGGQQPGPTTGPDGKTYYPPNFVGPIPAGAIRGTPPPSGSQPVHVTNPQDLPGGRNGGPAQQPAQARPVSQGPAQTQGDTHNIPGTDQATAGVGAGPIDYKSLYSNSNAMGNFDTRSPMQQFTDAMSGVGKIVGDAFKIFEDIIENIRAAAAIGDTLARGVENTEDIVKIITNVQSFIKTAGDVAQTVGDTAGAIAEMIPSTGGADMGGAEGAKAALSAVQSIASIVAGAIEATNEAISLGIEVYHEVGKYAGFIFGSVLGGALGTLGGNVRMLLNTRTGQIYSYSEDNPLNKNTIQSPFWQPTQNPTTTQNNQLNIYSGPSQQTPVQMMQNSMWMVSTGAPAVASVAAGAT